ncbi:MAG: phosphopantetheine-binding protein [Peptostreptococcaceae bacterium]
MDKNEMMTKYYDVVNKYVDLDVSQLDFSISLNEIGLNSFNAIQILVDLEETFEIEFPDEKVVPEMFETIGSIFHTLENTIIV